MAKRALAAAVLLFLLGLPVLAAEAPAPGPPAAIEPNRKRWAELSPEQKDRLREVYRRLEKLPPAERERLLARLRTMPPQERRRTIEMARQRASGTLPRRLPPEERRRQAEEVFQESLKRWLERLPSDLSERVQRFTRREQIELFRAYREAGLLSRAFPARKEEEALRSLPAEKLKALLKPGSPRPEGISEASWRRWSRLVPGVRAQLIRRIERLREEGQRGEPAQEGSAVERATAAVPEAAGTPAAGTAPARK